MIKKIYTGLFAMCLALGAVAQQQTKSPEQFLGYALGERFTPHHKIVAYYEHVAATNSNVKLEYYGETNELRPLMVAFISSPSNIDNLEQIRTDNLKRTGVLEGNPVGPKMPIVWLSYNVHGNEAVSSEATMLTLYELVNPANQETKKWLENTLVVMDPCINPDGRDRYAMWYNQKMHAQMNVDINSTEHNEPWPGGRANHYLFDLNRDWAWQQQIESQQRMKLYNKWLPQIHVDFHEQGINNPYYFAPAAEPLHKQITQWQRDFQEVIGRNHAKYFDKNSWFYFTGEVFDLLYPSYGDSYPIFNGAIGMTYEQGGSGRAGIGVLTAEGDTLTLKDRIAHHHTTGLSTIETSSVNATKLVDEFEKFFKENAAAPKGKYKAFVIKGNQNVDNLKSLAELMDKQGIKYGTAGSKSGLKGLNYQSGKAATFSLEKGDMTISAYQPKSVLAQVLFDPNPTLQDSITYDITSWALPYAYGLEAYALETRLDPSEALTFESIENKLIAEKPYAYMAKWNSIQDARFLSDLLNAGIKVRFAELAFELKGEKYDAGTLLITRRGNEVMGDKFDQEVTRLANAHARKLTPAYTGFVDKGKDFGSSDVKFIQKPKVAVLSGQGTSSLSYGEIWHYFEQELGYPMSAIELGDFARADMSGYNVLVMPSGYYSALGENGTKKLQAWVREGGKVIAVENATSFFADKEGFGLKRFASDSDKKALDEKNKAWDEKEQLMAYDLRERLSISTSISGGIFQVTLDKSHPLAFGLGDHYYTLKNGASRYSYLSGGWNVGTIKGMESHRSGFVGYKAAESQESTLNFGVDNVGRGQVIYFVDNPIFRSFWHQGEFLFANALFMVGQ